MKKLVLFFAVVIVVSLCFQWPGAAGEKRGVIKVQVQKLRSSNGQVILSLFNSPEGFPGKRDKALLKTQTDAIKDGAAVAEFKDVPYGVYAVGVLHDENSNGVMDKKYIFIPAEGVGASRDAKSVMGPPKFKDAQFELNTPEFEITVNMNYL